VTCWKLIVKPNKSGGDLEKKKLDIDGYFHVWVTYGLQNKKYSLEVLNVDYINCKISFFSM